MVLGVIPHKHKKAPTAPGITSYTITSKVRKRAVSPSMSTFYVGGKPISETYLVSLTRFGVMLYALAARETEKVKAGISSLYYGR